MVSLPEILYGLSADRLRSLAQIREVSVKALAAASDKWTLAQLLAIEISRPESVRAAILDCNAREVRLMQLLLSVAREDVVSPDAIVGVSGAHSFRSAVDAVVAGVESRGLVFRTPVGLFLPNSVRSYIPGSLCDHYTLASCLNTYDGTALRRICDMQGLPVSSGPKPELIGRIARRLLESGPGAHCGRPLDAEELAVLGFLIDAGGAASPSSLVTSKLSGQPDDFFRYDWQNRWKQGRERNAVDRLMALGVIFVIAHGYAYNLMLVIPGDLLRVLTGESDSGFWSTAAPVLAPLAAPPAATALYSGMVRDVVALLAFITTQEAPRTSTGHVHKATLKTFARMLSIPDERYAAFVYALSRGAGLIDAHEPTPVYAITEAGTKWLRADPISQLMALFEAWRDGVVWAEMYAEPLKKSSEYRSVADILRMRGKALELLAEYPGDDFCDVDAFLDALTYRYPLMLAESARLGEDLVSSPQTFVENLLECAAWLGLVELGWRYGGAPQYSIGEQHGRGGAEATRRASAAHGHRLTAVGAYALARSTATQPELPPAEDAFIVQPNGEIFAPPYLNAATLFQILLMTELPAKGAVGSTVALTRNSIRRALDAGQTTEEMLAFLRTHSRADIPQNVEYLLRELGGKHGHVRIGRARMYLQVDSPHLLQELLGRREMKGHLVRELSDTLAVLDIEDQDRLLRDLRKAGYLPVSDDRAPRGSLAGAPAELSVRESLIAARGPHIRATRNYDSVDWTRMAEEDEDAVPGEPKAAGGAVQAVPDDAVRQPQLVRFMLARAAREKHVVELGYRNGAPPDQRLLLLPVSIDSERLVAIEQATDEQRIFRLEQVGWIRLTRKPAD